MQKTHRDTAPRDKPKLLAYLSLKTSGRLEQK